jgi:hypothetical protein
MNVKMGTEALQFLFWEFSLQCVQVLIYVKRHKNNCYLGYKSLADFTRSQV